MLRTRWITGTIIAAGLLTISAPPAPAQTTRHDLRSALAELAKGVQAVVEKEGHTAVRVGVFSPLGLDDANAGAGISAALAAVLGATVNPKATLEVQGGYGFIEESRGSGIRVIKIKAKVVDTQNLEEKKAFLPLEGVVHSNPDIARLLGVTGELPGEGSHRERNKALQDLRDKPSVHIDGTLIASRQGSPYAIEIRVKLLKDHERHMPQARPATIEHGQAFVPIARDELYEVRVLNRSMHEVAVALSIDGLDQFAFSEDRVPVTDNQGRPVKDDKGQNMMRRFSHFIVAPAKESIAGELIIPGWHKTADPSRKDSFLSFLVTEYGKGAASKFPTLSQGKVGVITASFSLSFPKGTSRSGGETGFGPPVEVKQEVVQRVVDAPHDFVSVRYLR